MWFQMAGGFMCHVVPVQKQDWHWVLYIYLKMSSSNMFTTRTQYPPALYHFKYILVIVEAVIHQTIFLCNIRRTGKYSDA